MINLKKWGRDRSRYTGHRAPTMMISSNGLSKALNYYKKLLNTDVFNQINVNAIPIAGDIIAPVKAR